MAIERNDLAREEYLSNIANWSHQLCLTTLAEELGIDQNNFFIYVNDIKVNLTMREAETLYYACQGFSAKIIARHLSISNCTVELYKKSLREKTNYHCTMELIENIDNKKIFLLLAKKFSLIKFVKNYFAEGNLAMYVIAMKKA